MSDTPTITLEDIREAAKLLQKDIVRTPTLPARGLSEELGADVVLKLENLQHTGSFKVRGSGVRIARLSDSEAKKGVVAASAGNHAQGVAYHAQQRGIPSTIFMPAHTPFTKVSRTEAFGATVVLKGDDFRETNEAANEYAAREGLVFVHPYDDADVIAGQATVALEMLEDHPDIDVILVPVGGGGLIAGVATAAKAINPNIEVIGVQADLYPSLAVALQNDDAPTLTVAGGPTVAEGIAVKAPGGLPLSIIRDTVSDVLLVDEYAIEGAVQTYLEIKRIIAEGAGAASLAALKSYPERFKGRKVALIVSGGNIDSRLLSSILMRGLARDGRICRLRIQITDIPGALAKVSGIIGDAGANIIEVHHQRLFYDTPVKQTDLDVVVETVDAGHATRLTQELTNSGFPTRQLQGDSIQ